MRTIKDVFEDGDRVTQEMLEQFSVPKQDVPLYEKFCAAYGVVKYWDELASCGCIIVSRPGRRDDEQT